VRIAARISRLRPTVGHSRHRRGVLGKPRTQAITDHVRSYGIDEIVVPGRWLVARLEELARNPAAPVQLRAEASKLSRRDVIPDLILPAQLETVAVPVEGSGGEWSIIEALPPGYVITYTPDE
jgi:hypothetical protein